MTIGERYRMIRQHFGLSQRAFAERLSISGPSIARIESGVNNPAERTNQLVCREFNVSEAWLKDGVGEMLQPVDEDDAVNRIMLGESEFAKSVFRALAKLPPEAWKQFEDFVDQLKNGQ